MAVVSLSGFATDPGRLADHMAASMEALGHLRRRGQPSMLLQPISGGDIGTTSMVINYADNADGVQAIGADEQWQEFWAQASAAGAARQVESTLMNELDPGFEPAANRPLGALLAVQ
jgi:hypothetical protein